MAVLGTTLYFIVGGDRIESTLVGGGGSAVTVVQVPPCQGIDQFAAAGHELAYVVTSPDAPTAQAGDCGSTGRVSWSIWLLDLDGGGPHEVAQGTRAATSNDVTEFPVHLALTDTAYAFDRPPASAAASLGETVEVHSLDGRLLWTSLTQGSVASLMLGGSTLAILTNDTPLAPAARDLYTSNAADPRLAPVDQPASWAALSPDGSYLTWDVAYQGPFPVPNPEVNVAIEIVATGEELPVVAVTDQAAPAPLRPAITSTSRGLLVTWFATSTDGEVYPAVRYAAGDKGAFLPSLPDPIWMSVEGGSLFWVAQDASGGSTVAFKADLASLGLR
jgi:hypothetical protein